MESIIEKEVYTPLGKGRIVFKLKDGSLVVEFEHGGGHIFRAGELLAGRVNSKSTMRLRDAAGQDGSL